MSNKNYKMSDLSFWNKIFVESKFYILLLLLGSYLNLYLHTSFLYIKVRFEDLNIVFIM